MGFNVLQLADLIKKGDPTGIIQQQIVRNPQYQAFLSKNSGKTPEQIASDYGIDFNLVKNLLK